MGKKRQGTGDQSGTVTKKKKLDLIANPSTQGSSLASPEPPAIVTQKATVAAAKPSVIPGKENGALRKGSAKRKNGNITPKCVEATEQKSGAIKQESIKPTVHSAVITGEHSVPVTPEADTSLQVKAKKHPRRKNFCLEPQGKSWLPHIAGLVVHRLMTLAASLGIDPLCHPESICTQQGIFSDEDIRIMCQYISNQYPDGSVQSILSDFEPYAKLTEKNIIKHNVDVKYKDIIPKPPMSSYFLFHQRKLGSLKMKYPNLKATELSQKVGLKWNKLHPEKKELYTKEYHRLKEEYKLQLEQFYADHPDAKPISATKSTSKSALPATTHLQELKKLVPKCVRSAYALFCQERRKPMQAKHPELKSAEITVCLRSKWVKLSKEEKAPFMKQFEQMRTEYKTKMEQFIREHPDAEELLQTKSSKKAELPKANDDATQSQSLPVQTKDNKPDTNEDEIEKDANVTSDVDMPSSDEEESCEEEESSSD